MYARFRSTGNHIVLSDVFEAKGVVFNQSAIKELFHNRDNVGVFFSLLFGMPVLLFPFLIMLVKGARAQIRTRIRDPQHHSSLAALVSFSFVFSVFVVVMDSVAVHFAYSSENALANVLPTGNNVPFHFLPAILALDGIALLIATVVLFTLCCCRKEFQLRCCFNFWLCSVFCCRSFSNNNHCKTDCTAFLKHCLSVFKFWRYCRKKSTHTEDTSQTSRPGDTSQTSRPGDTSQTSRPGDTSQTSRPGDTSQTSRPGDTSQTSQPGSAQTDEYKNGNEQQVWLLTITFVSSFVAFGTHFPYIIIAWIEYPDHAGAIAIMYALSFLYYFVTFRQMYRFLPNNKAGCECCPGSGSSVESPADEMAKCIQSEMEGFKIWKVWVMIFSGIFLVGIEIWFIAGLVQLPIAQVIDDAPRYIFAFFQTMVVVLSGLLTYKLLKFHVTDTSTFFTTMVQACKHLSTKSDKPKPVSDMERAAVLLGVIVHQHSNSTPAGTCGDVNELWNDACMVETSSSATP